MKSLSCWPARRLFDAMCPLLCAAVLAAMATMVSATACAPTYPAKPIRFLMTAPAASSIDVIGRILADDLVDALVPDDERGFRPFAGLLS